MPELRRHTKEKHPEATPLKEEEVNKIDYLQWLASDDVPRATYNKYKHLIPSTKAPTVSNPLESTDNVKSSKRKAAAPLEKATRKKTAAVKTQPETQPSVAGQPLLEAAQPEWPTYVAPSASDQSAPEQPLRQRRGGKRQAEGRFDAPLPKKLILAITSSPAGMETRYGTAPSTQQESIKEASVTDRPENQIEQKASPPRRLKLKASGARRTAVQAIAKPGLVTDGSLNLAEKAGGNEQAADDKHHTSSQTREDTSADELPQHGDEDQDQNASKPQAPISENVVACETENAPGESGLEQASSQAVPTGSETLVTEFNVGGNIPTPILNQPAQLQAQTPADRRRQTKRLQDGRVKGRQLQEQWIRAAQPKTQQTHGATRVSKSKKKTQPTGKLRDGSRQNSYMVANYGSKGMPTGQQLHADYVFDPIGQADAVKESAAKGRQPTQAECPEKEPSDADAELQTMEEGDQQELADAPRSFPYEEAAKALGMLREANDPVLRLVENHVLEPQPPVPKAAPPKVNAKRIKNSLAKRVSSVFLSEVKQQYGIDPQTKREDLSRNYIMQAATLQLDDVHDEIEDIEVGHLRQTNGLYAEKAALGREIGRLRGEVDYQGGMITAQALEPREQDEEIDTLKAAGILKDINTADQQSELRRLRRLEKLLERAGKFQNW